MSRCPGVMSSRRLSSLVSFSPSHSTPSHYPPAVCRPDLIRVHPADPPRLPANGPPSTTSSPASTPSTCTSAPTTSASRRVSRDSHRWRPILWHVVLRWSCSVARSGGFGPCFAPYVFHALRPFLHRHCVCWVPHDGLQRGGLGNANAGMPGANTRAAWTISGVSLLH
jgi:hypothetical protein